MRLWTVITIVAALSFVACGPADIGETCDETGDCKDGLQCILSGGQDITSTGIACSTEKLCSIPCAVDTDCESVGSGLICMADCNAGSCLKGSH